jgi:hypothetical protein
MAVYEFYKHNLLAVRLQAETSEWKIINCGLRQGCSPLPLLFKIYMNKIIQKMKVIRHGNIPINRNVNIDTMLFADDQVLLAKSEDDLQYSVHNLNKIASEFSMEINMEKTRVMAFRGMEPIRSKICINNKTLKQQNTFNYVGYNISYEGEKDLNIKAANFVKVLGIINQIFKPSLISIHTRIRIYKTLAGPVLPYGSEAWTIKRTDERRLMSAEMRFLRRTAGYTRWDHKRNDDILTELQISQITEFVYKYRKNWKEHVDRMSSDRIPNTRMILKYQPRGKRNLGILLKNGGFSFVTPV